MSAVFFSTELRIKGNKSGHVSTLSIHFPPLYRAVKIDIHSEQFAHCLKLQKTFPRPPVLGDRGCRTMMGVMQGYNHTLSVIIHVKSDKTGLYIKIYSLMPLLFKCRAVEGGEWDSVRCFL